MEQFFAILGFVVALFIGGVLIGLLFMAVRNRLSAIGTLLNGQEQQLQLNQHFKHNIDALWRHIDRMQTGENQQATIFNKRLEKLEQKPARRTKTR